MTAEPYPNDADLLELSRAHDLLGAAGVLAGPNGYDVNALAAAAYGHGWSYRIDRAAGLSGYQVELRPQAGAVLQPLVTAVGWEPEVALAFALAKGLAPRARVTEPGTGSQAGPREVTAE